MNGLFVQSDVFVKPSFINNARKYYQSCVDETLNCQRQFSMIMLSLMNAMVVEES
jgi:serine protease inhibitor